MKCVVCKHGNTKPGTITGTFERNGTTIVVKNVPAEVCDSCGESYLSSEVSKNLNKQAEIASKQGVETDIRQYTAA